MNCFASFCCGVMLMPALGLVYILTLPLPSAMADELTFSNSPFAWGGSVPSVPKTYLNAGVDPDGNMAPIKIGRDGYVLCNNIRR